MNNGGVQKKNNNGRTESQIVQNVVLKSEQTKKTNEIYGNDNLRMSEINFF